MLFNSYIFVFLFLPITLLLYFSLNKMGHNRGAKIALVLLSMWFYGYFHISYLLLLIGSIVFNFFCSKFLSKDHIKTNWRKWTVGIGVIVNIGVIFYFKYYNFFLENMGNIFKTDIPLKEILMPLGISFFTFQQVSYLVDSYRGETKEYSFVDYALYVSFFPQLVAGPIVLHQETIPQFNDEKAKTFDYQNFARGIWLFAAGMFKKVMIADTLGKGVDWGYTNLELITGADAWAITVLYSLQIYFDFSGYCDMASGIASMFNIELPMNFNSPYKAKSILEFWQRWHMSLTRFLRKYVYYPLGGSRKGTVRTLINVLIVFLVSGIWHGASWTFILWGVIHGIANVLNRIFKKIWDKIPGVLCWFGTFLFVNLTWIVFRAKTVEDARVVLTKLLGIEDFRFSKMLLEQFNILELTYIEEHIGVLNSFVASYPATNLVIVAMFSLGIALFARNNLEKKFVPNMKNALGSIILLTWSIVSLSGIVTFLYFNF